MHNFVLQFSHISHFFWCSAIAAQLSVLLKWNTLMTSVCSKQWLRCQVKNYTIGLLGFARICKVLLGFARVR